MVSSPASPRNSAVVDEHTHVQNTPNSSVTMLERVKSLNEEAADDERRIHQYGGDDAAEPEPKPQPGVKQPALFKMPTPDPNMVTWDGPDDPANPQNWSKAKKWGVTAVCILGALNVSFASSAPTSATADIVQYFGISMEVSYLMTTLFLLGYVFGPVLWGPGSELVGRRPVFVVTMSAYTLLIIGQALAKNTETLLVTRFLSGFFAASPLTNSGGVIADIWDAEGRGPATSLFSASVFLGPVLGPVISGAIIQSPIHWRWVFWVMLIFAGFCNGVMILTLPETYAPVLLLKKFKHMRKADPEGTKHLFAEHSKQDWSFKGLMERTLFRPFIMLAIEPILLLITIYISLVYGVLYCLFQAIPIIFIQKRGFTILENGLIFIGVGIGAALASIFFLWSARHYPVLIKKWKGFPPPEYRLFGAMVGAPAFVIGIFWLGWTGNYASVHWAVPAVSTIVVGASINLIFMSFLSYLVDTYLMFAASAFAANTIIRSAVAAAFPLFTVQMFSNMTVKWAATLLGLVALLLAPSPFLFYKYGPRIREHSKFAPCIDLKIAKMMAEAEKQTA